MRKDPDFLFFFRDGNQPERQSIEKDTKLVCKMRVAYVSLDFSLQNVGIETQLLSKWLTG